MDTRTLSAPTTTVIRAEVVAGHLVSTAHTPGDSLADYEVRTFDLERLHNVLSYRASLAHAYATRDAALRAHVSTVNRLRNGEGV